MTIRNGAALLAAILSLAVPRCALRAESAGTGAAHRLTGRSGLEGRARLRERRFRAASPSVARRPGGTTLPRATPLHGGGGPDDLRKQRRGHLAACRKSPPASPTSSWLWGDTLRVDPLTPSLAMMTAPYHEVLVDPAGKRVEASGYFTGLVSWGRKAGTSAMPPGRRRRPRLGELKRNEKPAPRHEPGATLNE